MFHYDNQRTVPVLCFHHRQSFEGSKRLCICERHLVSMSLTEYNESVSTYISSTCVQHLATAPCWFVGVNTFILWLSGTVCPWFLAYYTCLFVISNNYQFADLALLWLKHLLWYLWLSTISNNNLCWSVVTVTEVVAENCVDKLGLFAISNIYQFADLVLLWLKHLLGDV